MNLTNDTSLALMQATEKQVANTINVAKNKMENTKGTRSLTVQEIEKIDAAAKDFEAMFISEMMKPMFEGIKPDEQFGGGKGEEIFSGMMVQEYGKLMAETGQLGIADSIKGEMIRMQEAALNGTDG